eukprot:1045526-Prymnesium_polylepis.1
MHPTITTNTIAQSRYRARQELHAASVGWRIRGLQPATQVAARALFAAGGLAPTSAATPIFCAESIG